MMIKIFRQYLAYRRWLYYYKEGLKQAAISARKRKMRRELEELYKETPIYKPINQQ